MVAVNGEACSDPRHLTITGLRIEIGGQVAVGEVSLVVQPGSIHCLVGDSGSGKTLTSLAAVGLLPAGATTSGSIRLSGEADDLLKIDQARWSSIRGRSVGYVGQNALGCLHPAYRVEAQLVEAIRRHRALSRADARRLVLEELAAVDLPDPERVARSRPAELSGGMCQRVALAIALCNRPSVLIADEPTTALDDETQSNVLDLIQRTVTRHNLGVLLITHDHRVVDAMADEITTITGGVSSPTMSGSVAELADRSGPAHTPAVTRRRDMPARHPGARDPEIQDPEAKDPDVKDRDIQVPDTQDEAPTLQISGVGKAYGRSGWRRKTPNPVLKDVTFSASAGTTIGLVGRSGAGKTTLAQIVAGVLPPSYGSVHIGGRAVTGGSRVSRVDKAGLVQYVFQDPFGSLNPRRSSLAQVAEPLIVDGKPPELARERAADLLAEVGLTSAQVNRLPTTLSGGQCQRVGIARALIRRPLVVVLDEPVSALDWSIRADILSILDDLQDDTDALYLLISHELGLIERQSDQIFEMTDGAVCQR